MRGIKQGQGFITIASLGVVAILSTAGILGARTLTTIGTLKSARFSGVVTEDGCANSFLIGDVGCSMTIDNIRVVNVHRGNAFPNVPWGKVEGVDSITKNIVGKKVKIYAHKFSPTSYSLAGSSNYYLKVIN